MYHGVMIKFRKNHKSVDGRRRYTEHYEKEKTTLDGACGTYGRR